MDVAFYKELRLSFPPEVYEPREDSFLLADQISVANGMKVLDIGTGTGIQAIVAAKQGADVLAVEINPHAIETGKINANQNGVADKIKFRKGSLFKALKTGEKFDLIIFNPPYLSQKDEEIVSKELDWIDYSYFDSKLILTFIKEYKQYLKSGGKALLVNSSLSGINVEGKIIATEKLAFETLSIIEIH